MTSNSMRNLHDISNVWTVLETSPAENLALTVAPLGHSVLAGEILAGVDAAGNHHILIPLLDGEPFVGDTTGKVVHLLRINQKDRSYLSAICLSRDLDDIFAQFARELLETIAESPSPARATRVALARWKTLFSAVPAGALTTEEQLGLLGELTLLRRLLEAGADKSTTSWRGPDKAQHDFRWKNQAVEVKATRSREGRRIHISSLEQLNPPPRTPLYLAFYRFEDDPLGSSLSDLVDEIAVHCSDPSLFKGQLFKWGYRDAQKAEYALLRCRVTEFSMYDVTGEAFPRIIPMSFVGRHAPSGTEQISYTIDISNDPPRRLSHEAVEKIFTDGLRP